MFDDEALRALSLQLSDLKDLIENVQQSQQSERDREMRKKAQREIDAARKKPEPLNTPVRPSGAEKTPS